MTQTARLRSMTDSFPNPEPWTPERQRLRAWLAENAPRLAPLYEASVRLLSSPEFPGRTHLLSHLVREIGNGLPQAITGRQVKRLDQTKALDTLAKRWREEFPVRLSSTDSPDRHTELGGVLFAMIDGLVRDHEEVTLKNRDKAALLFDALRPGTKELGQALEPVLRDWMKVIRWFQGHTHVPRDHSDEQTPAPEAELERQFRHFEDGLRGITEGFFGVLRVIDDILQTAPVGLETLDRLVPFLGGAEQLRHFFHSLEDPAWLEPLKKRDFFKTPPEPIVDEMNHTIAHTRWPALEFLVRMAARADAAESVTDILIGIKTDNVLVHEGIAEAALQLPARLAARLAPQLVQSLSHRSLSLLPKKISALTETLARSGEQAAAKRLLKALVVVISDPSVREDLATVLPPTPRTQVGASALHQLFDENLAGIVEGLKADALVILGDALDTALRLSHSGNTDDLTEDYSHIWRPNLGQDHWHDEDAKELLVTAVLKTAEQLAVTSDGVEMVIAALEPRRWPVFRRLALHVLTVAPSTPPALVATRLLDRSIFERFDSCREYRMLLHRSFGVWIGRQSGTNSKQLVAVESEPHVDGLTRAPHLSRQVSHGENLRRSVCGQHDLDVVYQIVRYSEPFVARERAVGGIGQRRASLDERCESAGPREDSDRLLRDRLEERRAEPVQKERMQRGAAGDGRDSALGVREAEQRGPWKIRLKGLLHLRNQTAASSQENPVELLRAESGSFERIGDGRKYREHRIHLGAAGKQEVPVEERRQDFFELR
jgi:hypothetical protein